MAGRAASTSAMRAQHRREKKPRLTHFLCLPLVNSASLPQLETSLASFKASIPRCSPKDLSPRANHNQNDGQTLSDNTSPVIPDAALRPVGTLHLTLGVMSLPTIERLSQAVEFLHSLDLVAILREAAHIASSRQKQQFYKNCLSDTPTATVAEIDSGDIPPQPFTISLESLHAFPRARSATVLHAAPVDHTARLYPFCVLLRDKFIEAGFILPDFKPDKSKSVAGLPEQIHKHNMEESTPASNGTTEETAVESSAEKQALLEELPHLEASEVLPSKSIEAENKPRRIQKERKPKLRPLVLHCTIANTIYIKGRPREVQNAGTERGRGNAGDGDGATKRSDRKYGRKNNIGNQRYSFDARDILSHYRDFYFDGDITQPRLSRMSITNRDAPCKEENDSMSDITSSSSDLSLPTDNDNFLKAGCASSIPVDKDTDKKRKRQDARDDSGTTSYPFVWARDFPLEKLCICEMGAKKLDANDHDGLGARLGEEYRVVAERSLLFDALTECAKNDDDGIGLVAEGGSDSSVDGGVAVLHPSISELPS